MSIVARAEALAASAVLSLPAPVQRVLAGRPVRRGGEALGLEPQLILRLARTPGQRPVERLPVPAGRLALLRQTRAAGGHQPIGSVRDLEVAGGAGKVAARLYVPRGLLTGLRPSSTGGRGDGMLVFFHGGAWVYGDLDSHDAVCRVLAEKAGVRVLAVDYRLAPEAPWPAAVDDAVAAYEWVVQHADALGADPDRLAVGGDSAGGNLAALVAIEAARHDWPLAFQLLVYPATDMTASMESRRTFGSDLYLTKEFMELGRASYTPDPATWTDPRVSPLFADLPEGLAPAYVATAALDPLRDEGEAYARRLEEAGAKVEARRFEGQVHGFFNMVGLGRSGPAAVAEIAAALRSLLS